MEKIKVLVICGPTASGKTALSVELALKYGGEIVNADSMQVYKGMEIASAKPSAAEKKSVPHHLMGFLSPTESFSVADYVSLAKKSVQDIHDRGKLPIITGGTGLYISSLIDNIKFDDTAKDEAFREKMRELEKEKGAAALWERLNSIDPETASQLHPNNTGRIIRALEVYYLSGRPISKAREDSRREPTPYDPLMLAIDYPDRQILYDRINKRVDKMLENGLVEEAKEFFTHKDYSTAAQAIGYKELRPYIYGEESLESCVEELKKQTRRYAKRQLTWFRRDERIHWLSAGVGKSDKIFREIMEIAENLVKTYSFYSKSML